MKIQNNKYTLPLSITCITVIFFLFPQQTYASVLSLKLTPANLYIQTKPPSDIWTPFTVENDGNESVNLDIGYKTFDPDNSQNGSVVFLKNGQQIPGPDKNIFGKIQIVDTQNVSHDTLTLGPGQKEQLRLHIALPQKEQTSDYYFSLIFVQNQHQSNQMISNINTTGQKSSSTLLGGFGMNVFLAIGDKESPQAIIDTFSTPLFRESGPVPFVLTVHNYSAHYFSANETLSIKNMYGQTIGKVIIPSSLILAGTTRTISNSSSSSEKSQDNTPLLIWPEKFLLGMYTATLSLQLNSNGPLYTRSIIFFAFPFVLVAEIILGIGLVIFIILRVKRKLS